MQTEDIAPVTHRHPRYRPHIDGLRAIAVMGVVLFHFGASWLPGGFLGVDVFFVISGFVISKSLYQEAERGQFSIISFYERRARRILPAFFVVTAATSVAAYFLLYTTALIDYAKSVIAASLFASNLYFYATSGYFAPSAIQIPLLHYWSLGVEEQFYLFFPLIVMAVYRWRQKALPWVIAIMAVASLIACELVRQKDPMLAFYFLPFRAFELLIGCGLALKGVRFPADKRIASALVAIGLGLILGSMLLINEAMRFPGLLCLPPCIGAALIIYGGDKVETGPSKLLSLKPLLSIGAISYSLYLVHWPIVVFLRMARPNMDAVVLFLVGVALSLALAWMSYTFVEQPFRKKTELFTRGRIFAAAAASMAILIGFSIQAVRLNGLPERLSPEVNNILAYQGYPYAKPFREGTCFLRPEQSGADIDLSICLPGQRPNLVMWGDSAIAQYYSGMAPLLQQRGIAVGQLTASACPPIQNLDIPGRPNCKSFNDFALTEILKARPDTVVLGSVWTAGKAEMDLADKTIAQLVEAGIKVVILGPPSFYRRPVPIILANRRMAGNLDANAGAELDSSVSVARDNVLRAHFKGRHNINYVSIPDSVCNPDCLIDLNNVPLHFDILHLTKEGSDYYASKLIDPILK